ncbi:ABC transporter substrate-binding protein [Bordetella petrii]|nr:ABC transporter substrate-binding protein [Bordetella petrii]
MHITRRQATHLLAATLLGPLAFGGAQAQQPEPILIGASMQVSGPIAYVGESVKQGLELQVDAINAAGGLLGRPVKILYRDHENVPDKAVTNVRGLIEQEKVVAMIGESSSGTALAAGPIIGAAHLPWLIAAATNSTITTRPENVTALGVTPYDRLQAPAVVALAAKKYKKLALLTDTSGYGQGGRNDLLAALKERGITPVADETYNINSPSMTAQLARIRDSGADALLLWSVGPDAAQIRRNMRTMRFEIPTIGGWGLENTSFLKLAGKYAEGTIIMSVNPLYRSSPQIDKYRAAYDKKYGLQNIEYASAVALAYDAMGLLANGIRKAGSTDPQALMDALKTVEYDGVVKQYRSPWANANRQALTMDDLHFVVVRDGKFVPYTD